MEGARIIELQQFCCIDKGNGHEKFNIINKINRTGYRSRLFRSGRGTCPGVFGGSG
jgi:hypothetical protein